MKLQDNNMNLYEICYNDPLEADLKQKCQKRKVLSVLLLGYTDSSAATSGGLGVLSTNPEAPVMTKSPMCSDLLQPLEILTQLVVKTVGQDLAEFSVFNILLSVQEPVRDLVLAGVVHNRNHTLNLLFCQFTRSFGHVNICLLANDVRESTSATLNSCHREQDLVSPIDVCVHDTKNVLELFWHN